MNFEYSEEQNALKDSIVRWAQDNYSFEQRRVGADSDNGFSQNHYNTFAELGWLSVPFSEENGGYGGSVVDIAAVMEEFGKALVVEPVFPNLILFGGLLERSTNDAIKADLIPQVIDGSLMGAVALYEPQAHFDASNIATSATEDGKSYLISGHKSVVLGGAHAKKLIVVARTSGAQTDEDGLSLFLLDAGAAGVTVNAYPLMDGQQVADIHFDNASAQLIGDLGNASSAVKEVLTIAHVALAAEAVGLMEVLNRTTIEYTKTRKQFGVTISSFQVLQHRMVDTFMSYEQAKSLLIGTLVELTDDRTTPQRASKMVNALRTLIAKNGKHIGDEAIQLHGGMGLTDEMNVGHYHKRMMMINLMFGNGDFFQNQFNQVAYASECQ
ncbi:MAG: acyl-CoA dehydrogenase family protein [Arenicella sp.]|nr:acyl-CoA dehydrogenase family protein [Arenicella sp.]